MKHSLVSHVRRFLSSDSEGGALVEMAVTLPLVLLIMTGIFSFSVALYQKLQLAEAVSNAGHYLATARGDHDPCATAVGAVTAGAPGLNPGNLTVTLSLNGTTLPATCPGTGTAGPSSTFSTAQGESAMVQASYPTGLAIYGTSFTTVNLGAVVSEVIQ